MPSAEKADIKGTSLEKKLGQIAGLDMIRNVQGELKTKVHDRRTFEQSICDIIDNSIDETLAGYCNEIFVILNAEGTITVEDNGRGIPVELHKTEKIPAAQLIMTELHAGGKFDQNSYKISGGLHGVGVSVVNALSEKLLLEINRDGKIYYMDFIHGAVNNQLKKKGESKKNNNIFHTGTKITFLPSKKTFNNIDFNFKTIENRLRELAFLNTGVVIILIDRRSAKENIIELSYDGGIIEYVKFLNQNKNSIHGGPIYFRSKKNNKSFFLTTSTILVPHSSQESISGI